MTGDITRLLAELDGGDPAAHSRLVELLYPELRKIAELRMRSERSDHTLQPTALVNEFFLKLARQGPLSYRNRSHFLATASEAMRKVLIDHARAHRSAKRGGQFIKIQLDDHPAGDRNTFDVEVMEIDELLRALSQEEPRMARVVEMHCFGGLTFREIGGVLEIDERTAKRDWQVARAWLLGKMGLSNRNVGGRLGKD